MKNAAPASGTTDQKITSFPLGRRSLCGPAEQAFKQIGPRPFALEGELRPRRLLLLFQGALTPDNDHRSCIALALGDALLALYPALFCAPLLTLCGAHYGVFLLYWSGFTAPDRLLHLFHVSLPYRLLCLLWGIKLFDGLRQPRRSFLHSFPDRFWNLRDGLNWRGWFRSWLGGQLIDTGHGDRLRFRHLRLRRRGFQARGAFNSAGPGRSILDRGFCQHDPAAEAQRQRADDSSHSEKI
jgi:hypothetical protein